MTLPPLHVPTIDEDRGDGRDPLVNPALFDGVPLRRVVAVSIDWLILLLIGMLFWMVGSVVWALTFGLAGPLLGLAASLIPLLYHSLLLAGAKGATFGMRLVGIHAESLPGGRLTLLQALLHTVAFYVSIGLTVFLVLLFPLFNRRRQTLHDMLAGALFLRTLPGR